MTKKRTLRRRKIVNWNYAKNLWYCERILFSNNDFIGFIDKVLFASFDKRIRTRWTLFQEFLLAQMEMASEKEVELGHEIADNIK